MTISFESYSKSLTIEEGFLSRELLINSVNIDITDLSREIHELGGLTYDIDKILSGIKSVEPENLSRYIDSLAKIIKKADNVYRISIDLSKIENDKIKSSIKRILSGSLNLKKEAAPHLLNAKRVIDLQNKISKSGLDLKIGYVPDSSSFNGFAGASFPKSATSASLRPYRGNIYLSGEAFKIGDIAQFSIHEVTHTLDENIRLSFLTDKGKKFLEQGKGYDVFDVPKTPEYFNREFLHNYLYKINEVIPSIREKGMTSLGKIDLNNEEFASYLLRSEEVLARGMSDLIQGRQLEDPRLKPILESIIQSSKIDINGLLNEIAKIPELTSVRRGELIAMATIGEHGVLYAKGFGSGGGMDTSDALRKRIEELLRQRLGQVFEQLSPEKINQMIEGIISGEVTRIHTGGVQFRTTELRRGAEKYVQDLLQNIGQQVSQGAMQGVVNPQTGGLTAAEIARKAAEEQRNQPPRTPAYVTSMANDVKTLNIQGKLTPEQIQQVSKGIEQEADRLKKLDAELTSVSSKSRTLSDNTVGVTTAFRDQEKVLTTLKQYVVQTKEGYEVLGEAAFRASQKAKTPYTQQQIAGFQGTYKNAFALAGQSGFKPEDLQSANIIEPNKIAQLKFAAQGANGEVVKLGVAVDKFGGIMMQSQRHFRSFAESISRDVTEVFKWSIAVSLIYGPMYKLQELVRTAVENETKLVDITIALGNAQRGVNDIFSDAARIANAAGESINGVLEGYVQAYRAAGSIEDPIKRTEAANTLLTDSLILSKLSALDQAKAMDILVGALEQTKSALDENNQPLDDGRKLIDSWIAVSRKASVDLETLATAFSITGETALNAGVNFKELNGIIAVLSQSFGTLGPTEVGNAARAIIGGIYGDAAQKELQRFGVTVEDTTGKTRDLMGILKEIYSLNQQGLISEDQMNRLALALGGGVRRGNQFLAVMKGIGDIDGYVAAQANAHGLAEEALAKKLDTVQTSVTQLGNGFQELAQTLGTKGGVLDLMKDILSIANTLVGAFTDITGALGKAGPMLLTFLGAAAYFSGDTGGARYKALQGRVGGFLGGGIGGVLNLLPGMRSPITRYTGEGTEQLTRGQVLGQRAGSWLGQYGPSIIAGAFPAIQNFRSGNPAEAVGNLSGALIGALISGGNPIGAAIGSAIAEMFVSKTKEYLSTEQDIFTNLFPKPRTPQGTEAEGTISEARARELNVFEKLYQTLGPASRVWTGAISGGGNIAREVGGALGINVPQLNQQQTALAFLQLFKQYGIITQEAYNDALKGFQDLSAAQVGSQTKEILSGVQGNYFANLQKELQRELLSKLISGEVSAKQYREGITNVAGVPASVTSLNQALGPSYQDVIKGAKSQEDVFKSLAEVMLYASAEETKAVAQQAEDINLLNKAIADAGGGMVKFGKDVLTGKDIFLTTADAQSKLSEDTEVYRATLESLNNQVIKNTISLPTTASFTGITMQQFEQQVVPLGRSIWEDYLSPLSQGQQELSKAQANSLNVILDLLDGYKLLPEAEKIPLEFLQKAFDQLKEKGKIDQQQTGIGFQTFNVSNAVLEQVTAQSRAMALQWQTAYGYTPDINKQITIDKKGIIEPMEADWKIVQYLLGQIADNTEKTVDGIFNLPENASFWFPSGLLPYLQAGGGGGGGGMPSVKGGGTTTESNLILGGAEKRGVDYTKQQASYNPLASAYPQPQPSIQELLQRWGTMPPNTYRNWGVAENGGQPDMQTLLQNYGIMPGAGGAQKPNMPWWWMLMSGQMGGLSGIGQGLGIGGTGPISTEQAVPQTRVEEQRPLNFRLELESRTQLIVDGRVLADIIKPYIAQSMVQADGTQGAANLKVAI